MSLDGVVILGVQLDDRGRDRQRQRGPVQRAVTFAIPRSKVAATDHELIGRMQADDRDAFGELYDRYCDRAYRVARAVSVDDSRAQEGVQEGFLSIWNSRASYRPQHRTAAPWLMTVVRHRAIDVGRRHATHEARHVNDATLERHSSREDLAGDAVDRALARDLKALLHELPDAQREVIVLAFYGGLTHTEIANELGLPIGTVKGRMRGGLHKLRVAIEPIAA